MINLAGNKYCDETILRELSRIQIPAIKVELSSGEVPYSYIGELESTLGKITLTRAWYYWVASGPVPMDMALKLYADPVGKTDIRVTGNCGCPPPENPWVKHFDKDGAKISLDRDGSQQSFFKENPEYLPDYKIHFVSSWEEAESIAVLSYIDSYHIDSELGLKIFSDMIRGK